MQSFLLKTGSQNRDTESHFFWLQILPHELGWNVALVLAKTFLRWSQRSYLNMKKQRFRSVFCTNLENPCFLLNKDIWIHYLRLIVDNLTRSFALLKCWELRRFYCYFNLSPKIIAWSLLEMKNLLGLLFLHTITHPYMILEIWLDRKAGKKLQPNY